MIGKLVGIYIGSIKGEGKAAVESAELIIEHGLRGDSHAGSDIDRQVSFFAVEVLRQIEAEGFKATPEELSANLLTENIQLESLKPGSQLRVGDTLIEIVEARRPCRNITKIDNRLPKRLYGQCGQLGRVVQGGIVRTGDIIEECK
jgi:MOSC domain-containing protein YiiM